MSEAKAGSSATILLAPAGGGKTQRLVELLVGDRSSIQPRWAVLPDRTQVSIFRRRIADAGGALGVSVGTFGDLFQEILARAGRPLAVTPEPARQRLLRLALRQLEAEGQLPYYQPIVRRPGFLEVVGGAIAELKRARVGPEAVLQLAAAPVGGPPAGGAPASGSAVGPQAGPDRGAEFARNQAARLGLTEMARIYADYEARLAAIPWTDREGLNALAIEALNQRPDLLADMPMIVVDGFDSFEAAQLEALQALAAQVEQLVVALPGEQAMRRAAYRRFAKPLSRLRQALPEAAIEQLEPPGGFSEAQSERRQTSGSGSGRSPGGRPPRRRPEPLVRLEAGLFEREVDRFDAGRSIELIEARSAADEAREALRWLKARLVRDQLGLEECAVIAPDSERYGPLLRRAAAEFGVRLRFTHGEPLAQAPAVSALLDLLELGRSNWPRRLTLQAIRSPFFDLSAWSLRSGDALLLDAASHAGQVIGGLDQWEEALSRLAQAEPDPGALDLAEDLPISAAPIGEAAARLLAGLQALARQLTPAGPRTTGQWVEWLEDLLDDLGYPERTALESDPAGAERRLPAFERLRETLRALVLGEVVTGSGQSSYGEFLDELRGAVEAAHYREQPRAFEPAVNVLGLLEARGGRYQAVVVVGLSEGLLPQVEREDPFLDEGVRAALGLESRLGREQPGLFYQAVTRADFRLLLTRPYLADDGEAWEASPFWRAAERMLSEPPRRVRPEDPRPLQEAGSPQELLFWGVRRGGMPASLLEPQRERWAELQHGRDVLAARGERVPDSPYEGDLAALAGALSERFGAEHLWSPSRLETYGSCPHMFYASYLLGLEVREPPEPGLDAAQLGSILHEILEAAYGAAEDPTDVESLLTALDEVLDPIMDRAPERHGFRPTPLWAIERAQHAEALRETIRALHELSSDWRPIEFELRFGLDGQPALELELGPGGAGTSGDDGGVPASAAGGSASTVRVRGVIDRLDRRADGGLRVIDYKTGRSRLNARELDEGRRIQLPLYALAAQQALELGEVVDGFYWAILAAERGSLRLSNYRPPEPDVADRPVSDASSEQHAAVEQSTSGQPRSGLRRTAAYGPAAAASVARAHVARIVDGVRAGAFPPVPPPGGCPEYCPAAAWCWRYQPARWS